MGGKIAFTISVLLISFSGFSLAQNVDTPLSVSDEAILEQLTEINLSLDEILTLLSKSINQKENALRIENMDTLDRNITFLYDEWFGVCERLSHMEAELEAVESELTTMETMLTEEDASANEFSEEALATYDALNVSLEEKLFLAKALRRRKIELEDTLERRRAQREALVH